MNVEVVFIPDLLRHIAKGWSEDQLLTGRVATLGRATLSVAVAEDATLLALARAVEDLWGTAVADQAYRWRGNSLALRDTEVAARRLVDLGMPLPPARAPRVLMSAGAPANVHAAAGAAQARTATTLRSPTQVEVITQEEADAACAAEETAQPAPAAVTPFTGASHTLAASTTTSAAAELTPAERRERAAAAAAHRAAVARDA